MNEPIQRWLRGDGLTLAPAQRVSHTYVIGQPGMGKSFALESWAMQDIRAGRGVGVIDVHGDLFRNLVSRLALLAQTDPSLAERVVIIDPSDPTWTVGFNPLEPIPGVSRARQAWFLTDAIVKIWQIDPSESPRMLRLLSHTFLALSEHHLSLVDLPPFLCDSVWRGQLLQRTRDPALASYFQHEFPRSESAIQQWTTPVLNKVGPLIFDPDVRLMLGARSTIHFRQILDHERILLVNLSKGLLSEGNSALLGAFLMAQLQQAALSRADSGLRRPFYLYLDEFQNYTTDHIKDVLSESRKYSLSLVLAHQYLDQLPDDLRGAVLNTTGTLACFRVGHADASVLAKEIFPLDFLSNARADPRLRGWGRFLSPLIGEDGRSGTAEALAALLTNLKERQFWAKRRGPHRPVKQRTLEMPVPSPSHVLAQARQQLRATAGTRYGMLKTEARKQAKQRIHDQPQATRHYEKA
ncbi:MAG: hypothetical protein HY259_05005 [Chloroflexi bacterium]|nr:hypothetical protein [Chloroflexota bacterium]